jgi:hypothetical protein
MNGVRFLGFVLVGFAMGYWIGSHHRSSQAEASLDATTCPLRCVAAIKSILILWPSLETALTLMRVIPNTALACERICVAKQIKNL